MNSELIAMLCDGDRRCKFTRLGDMLQGICLEDIIMLYNSRYKAVDNYDYYLYY